MLSRDNSFCLKSAKARKAEKDERNLYLDFQVSVPSCIGALTSGTQLAYFTPIPSLPRQGMLRGMPYQA